MSDSMFIEGKEYISSKRASEMSGYAQDYIGQLARKGLIAAQRVGGLWFVAMASLTEYKSKAEKYVPQLPERKEPQDPESLIAFDGKDHVSASRAAKITGYHPDYVGQLARSGTIVSRQVGNRWYVDREGILAHKKEKDGLLGAVQAQAVGIAKGTITAPAPSASQDLYSDPGPFLTYTRDDRDLLPVIGSRSSATISSAQKVEWEEVPIRVVSEQKILHHIDGVKPVKYNRAIPGKTMFKSTYGSIAAAALTVVIVLSFGFATLKSGAVYSTTANPKNSVLKNGAFAAGAATAFQWVEGFVRDFLSRELVYRRAE